MSCFHRSCRTTPPPAPPPLHFLLPVSILHSLAKGHSIYYSRPLCSKITCEHPLASPHFSFPPGEITSIKEWPPLPTPHVSNLSWIRAVIYSMWALRTCEHYISLPFITDGRCAMLLRFFLSPLLSLTHSHTPWTSGNFQSVDIDICSNQSNS